MSELENIPASQIRSLLEVGRLLTVTADIDLLFLRIAQAVTSILSCERASIFLYDASTDELWTKVALQSGEIRVPAGVGIVGHAFRQNLVINVPDAYSDKRFCSEPDRQSGLTRNLLTVPMLDLTGTPVGVVQALNRISGAFDPPDAVMLQLLANQAAVAFQRWCLQASAVKAASLEREMALARAVQLALIPKSPLVLPYAEADGWTQSADLTGGDCFDFWPTPAGSLGVFIGDASGHGIAPALVISQVRTMIRSLSELDSDPARILMKVNSRLAEDLEKGSFVTAFLGFLEPGGRLNWFSAGQAPIFLRASFDLPLQILDASIPPLASSAQMTAAGCEIAELQPGGMLTVVSDGILEALDGSDHQFGKSRIIQLMDALRGNPPGDFITAVRSAVQAWQKSATPRDDQTILAIGRI
jgi:serine phosphatase RsbU (regulator of sigma subunit)